MLMSPSAKAHKPGAHHAKDETLTVRVVVAAHRVLVAEKAHIVSIQHPSRMKIELTGHTFPLITPHGTRGGRGCVSP